MDVKRRMRYKIVWWDIKDVSCVVLRLFVVILLQEKLIFLPDCLFFLPSIL